MKTIINLRRGRMGMRVVMGRGNGVGVWPIFCAFARGISRTPLSY